MKIKTAIRGALIAAVATTAVIASAPAASAGTNGGQVHNKSGSPVKIWCDYGKGAPYWLYEDADKGEHHWSTGTACAADTDQAMSYHDGRCLKIVGPRLADGYYYAKPDKKYKIYGATIATFEAYSSSRCSKSKEYPVT